jgi:hypothetical protein
MLINRFYSWYLHSFRIWLQDKFILKNVPVPDCKFRTIEQETDADLFSNSIKIKPVQACLHDKTLYPITFENAVGAVDLWPHDCKDGYGVLTFEVLGVIWSGD